MGGMNARRFALALIVCVSTSNAAAAPAADFPKSLERVVLVEWLRAKTDLPPQRVAVAGPLNAIAVLPSSPATGSTLRRATVHIEALDPKVAQEVGYSFAAELSVDCKQMTYASASATAYAERRRLGKPKVILSRSGWVAPASGDELHTVIRAVCEDSFVWPLATPKAIATDGEALQPAILRVLDQPSPKDPRNVSSPSTRGGVKVQVAATTSRAEALAAGSAAMARIADNKALKVTVEPASIGGKQLFRSRVGDFPSLAHARAVCRALEAGGLACFVATR